MATKGSDEIFDTVCSPCRKEHKNTEGDLFCLDCQDYYCSECVKFHKKIPALSAHKIIAASEFQSMSCSLPIVPTERCKRHATKVVDMYCTDHKIVACLMCTTLEHTSCKKLYVPENIGNLMKLLDINGVEKDCAEVGKAAKEKIQVHEDNLRTLMIKKENALKELTRFRKEIIVWLDDIERRAIEQLDTECAATESKWNAVITDLQKGIEEMEQYVRKLDSAAPNQCQQFVCLSLCKEITSSVKQQTQEIYPDVNDLMFTPCLELKTLIKSCDILGTSSTVPFNCSPLDMATKSKNIMPTSDKNLEPVGARAVHGQDLLYLETQTKKLTTKEMKNIQREAQLSAMAGGQSNPQKVVVDAGKAKKEDDDVVFETFSHRSGQEFPCIYQSGMRFYLDNWGSKDWQPFPKHWYNEGLLVTNTILKDEGNAEGTSDQQDQGQLPSKQGQSKDREGFLLHPTKGRISTCIFHKKQNVHMYFDKEMRSWIQMPIGWELHHDMVKSLVDQVEEAVPSWQDRHDMLALLRACNYDIEECITVYVHLQNDEWMKEPKTNKELMVLKEKESYILKSKKSPQLEGSKQLADEKLGDTARNRSVKARPVDQRSANLSRR